ncbi:hypothetical protein P5673_006214 [Acropora cervicornis]|uniref:Uncharacterized protein n=1 Tax=Acropora cervicornis TaxID=6130 RepID=A0AAD9QY92_ACRCE|nr:hypothetical protein P5673_006214 [Acropora cervicornis]
MKFSLAFHSNANDGVFRPAQPNANNEYKHRERSTDLLERDALLRKKHRVWEIILLSRQTASE